MQIDSVVVVFPECVCVGGILSGIGEFFDGSDHGLGLAIPYFMGRNHCDCVFVGDEAFLSKYFLIFL